MCVGRFKSWARRWLDVFQIFKLHDDVTWLQRWVPGAFAIVHVCIGIHLFVEGFFWRKIEVGAMSRILLISARPSLTNCDGSVCLYKTFTELVCD